MTRTWLEQDDKVFDSHLLAVKLIELAKKRGASIDKLLRGTGMFYEDMHRGTTYVSYQQIATLIENIVSHTSSRDISFLAGRRLFPNPASQASELINNARNLSDMLRLIACYQRQIFPFLTPTSYRDDQRLYLQVSSAFCADETKVFFMELACAALNALCKWHLGKQVPLHFYFQQKRPKNIYQYEENLGHRLNFNQPMDLIGIDLHRLTAEFPESNSVLRYQHRQLCQSGRKTSLESAGLLQFVMRQIQSNPKLGQDELAERMDISPATLKRKLKAHKTSFKQLQDLCKSQQAIFDLRYRGLTNEETAMGLSIESLANFRRAVKRWTGMTPSQIRCLG